MPDRPPFVGEAASRDEVHQSVAPPSTTPLLSMPYIPSITWRTIGAADVEP